MYENKDRFYRACLHNLVEELFVKNVSSDDKVNTTSPYLVSVLVKMLNTKKYICYRPNLSKGMFVWRRSTWFKF
jgi:hypothetical protein